MPRPCKRRRVCALPGCRRFGDLEGNQHQEPIEMAVDEFEAIRLVDLLDLTQEEAARQMALSLVEGRELRIGGGEYQVCPGDQGCPHCPKISAKGAKSAMKIAVTYENGQVFQHFGHTAQFKIYEVQDGQVASSQVVDTNGSGHGALAGFLNAQGVDTLICGGIGGGARTALAQAGIQLYGGVSGSADQAVEDLLAQKLVFQPDILCSHHEGHGEGHSCGDHGCGSHGCGTHGCGTHGCH